MRNNCTKKKLPPPPQKEKPQKKMRTSELSNLQSSTRTGTNLVIPEPYVIINNGENKNMIMVRLRLPVLLWSSKYLRKRRKMKIRT